MPSTTYTAIPIVHPRSRSRAARLPYLLLLVLITLLWFPEPLALPGGMSAATFVLVGSVLIACRSPRLAHRLDRSTKYAILALVSASAFILFWSTLSIFFAVDPVRAGRVLLTHLFGASILLLIFVTFTPERGRQIVNLMIAISALMSAVTLAAYFDNSLYKVLFGDTDRSRGFFKHPNQFGMVLAVVAPVAIMTMLSSHRAR